MFKLEIAIFAAMILILAFIWCFGSIVSFEFSSDSLFVQFGNYFADNDEYASSNMVQLISFGAICGAFVAILVIWWANERRKRSLKKSGNGDLYRGDLMNGKEHGKGVKIYANGKRYKGEFMSGKKHGKGKIVYPDQSSYYGDFLCDKKHGVGLEIYSNGDRYAGQFKHGLRHGSGVYCYVDGGKYCGEYRMGKKYGLGERIWADGKSFRGSWEDGKFIGKLVGNVNSCGKVEHDDEVHMHENEQ